MNKHIKKGVSCLVTLLLLLSIVTPTVSAAAEVINASTPAQLNSALQYAGENLDVPIDIHITGNIAYPNGSIINIPANVYFYIDRGALFEIQGGKSYVYNAGVILIYGTISVSNNVINTPTAKAYLFNGSQVRGNEKFITGGEFFDYRDYYEVLFNANGGTYSDGRTTTLTVVSMTGSRLVTPPAEIPVNAGYILVGWYTAATGGTEWNFAVNTVSANMTLYARWEAEPTPYTVTFNSNGGSAVAPQTVLAGQQATAPANPVRAGYAFDGWYTDDNTFLVSYNFSSAVNNNITLYAKWVYDPTQWVTISYVSNGGSAVASQTILKGGIPDRPTNPTRYGYLFDGWFTDDNTFVVGYDFNAPINSDTTLYARWIRDISLWKLVTFDSNGGSAVASQVILVGENAVEPANPAKYAYLFDGWYTDNGTFLAKYNFSTPITNEITLYAKWNKDPAFWVTVTFVNGDPTKGTISGQLVFEGIKGSSAADIVAPTTTRLPGYQFAGWTPAIPSIYPNADLTITANWDKNPADWTTITFVNSDPDKGSLTGTLVFEGIIGSSTSGVVPPTPVPAKGYMFDGWSPPTIPATYPGVNTVIVATWDIDPSQWSTVTFVNGDPTKGELIGQLTFSGIIGESTPTIVAPSTVAGKGYRFAGWTPATIPTAYPATNMVITANWEKDPAQWSTVTFVNGDSTKGSLSGQLVFEGIIGESTPAIVRPTTTPVFGYQFAGWTPAAPTVYPSANMTVTATWEVNPNDWSTITFVGGDSTKGSISGQLTFSGIKGSSASDIVQPTRTPVFGYMFAGWSPAIPGTYPNADLTITATWDINPNDWSKVTFVNGDPTMGSLTGILEFYGIKGSNTPTITPPTTIAAKGYRFAGWTPSPVPTIYPNADLIVTANWEKDPAQWTTVTFVNSDSTKGSLVGQLVFEGIIGESTPPIVAPTPVAVFGYQFAGWTPAAPTTYPSANMTVTANWEENPNDWATVTFDSDGGSAVASQKILKGEKATRPADPTKAGYVFDDWYLNGAPYDFDTPVTGDITLVAQWNDATFEVIGGIYHYAKLYNETYQLVVNTGGVALPVEFIVANSAIATCDNTGIVSLIKAGKTAITINLLDGIGGNVLKTITVILAVEAD